MFTAVAGQQSVAVRSRDVACNASTPRQKATKRHVRARPIKYTPADKNRTPHEYAPLPPAPPAVVVISKSN
ncbi:hypothetical protein OEZ86_002164 [Tetradesmus obliquus]|uniref:Uncharacterized protein n=2 Tax=Tetradesmus obliquus TaxID=3088 RepID=A0ABY8UD56_TETOB|nr:hypothetical protein OEZ85_010033 [Tetradesmus obliquus]WIA38891.1 hypothetical protein OEZ86_002164 [Tetradesmus obliquus]|eukprot:jgi/Sobl393_1/8409/SZX77989.1